MTLSGGQLNSVLVLFIRQVRQLESQRPTVTESGAFFWEKSIKPCPDLNLRPSKIRASSALSSIHRERSNSGLTQILKVEMIVIPRPYQSRVTALITLIARDHYSVLSVGRSGTLFIYIFVPKYQKRCFKSCINGQINDGVK